MAQGYELLSHTADVGFRAWADSMEELFEASAAAMFSIEYDLASVPRDQEVSAKVSASDLVGLMEMWLSEWVFLHDARGFVPSTFSVNYFDGTTLSGSASGSSMGDWFSAHGPQIKAVTLHELEVISTADHRHTARVYLDV